MAHFTLKTGESIIRTVRQHPIVAIVKGTLSFLLVLFALFFMLPLTGSGRFGQIVFALLIFLGAFFLFRTWLLWHSNRFIITDRRVVDIQRNGFFDWVVSEAAFGNIQDISVTSRGIVQAVLGAGNVVVQTASGFVNLVLTFVRDPGGVKETINVARGVYQD